MHLISFEDSQECTSGSIGHLRQRYLRRAADSMRPVQHGMIFRPRAYATIAPARSLRGKGPLLSLEHFLQRQRALALWRDIIRAVHKVPPSDTREELRDFARTEYQRYKHITDLDHIRYLISTGKTQLDSMRRYVEQQAR